MLNDIVIMGRLVRDPELRVTQNGVSVASFTIACERDRSTGSEKQTDFIDCVAWRGTADFVSNYLKKGSMAIVAGRLQIRNYTDKNGNKRYAAEIVADRVYFGGSKSATQAGAGEAQPAAPDKLAELEDQWAALIDDDETDLPF